MSLLNNTMWSLTNIIGIQLLAVITNVILARILYPEIFGILGMATVFTGFILVFQEAGLSSFLIYKDKLDKGMISTSFWMNVMISLVLGGITYSMAAFISTIYHIVELKEIIHYISFGLIFASFGITSRALLTKGRRFKALTIIDVIAEVATSITSITLAVNNFDLLAITSRLLIKPCLQSTILIVMNKSNLFGRPSWSSVKEIIPYSSKFLGSQIFIYLNNSIDLFLIGKLLGARNLGMYTVSYQWSVLARMYISGSINKVVFPEISRKKDDKAEIRRIYLQVLNKLSFFTFPICIGLFIIAPEFIVIVYGEVWRDAIPVLQILLLAGMITSIGTIGGSVFNGVGKPHIEMRLNFISIFFLAAVIYICSFYGLIAISIGILVRVIIFDFIKMSLVNKVIGLNHRTHWKNLLPSFYSTFTMAAALFIGRYLFINHFTPMVRASLLIVLGGVVYIVASYFFNYQCVQWVLRKVKLQKWIVEARSRVNEA
jgi:O-antigen/teichoic acid export membrane protein